MNRIDFGARVVEARQKRQWKQAVLSRLAEIPTPRLSKIENGKQFPRPEEWERLATVLELPGDNQPRVLPPPVKDWRAKTPDLSWDAARLPSRAHAARKTFGASTVEEALAAIVDRGYADEAELFLQRASMDSGPEYKFWIEAMAAGGRPCSYSPLKAGFTSRSIIDRNSKQVAGHIKHSCLELTAFGGSCLLFPQVSIETRKGVYRLDALVLLRIRRDRFWVNLELDGHGHDATFDKDRQEALGLDTIRLGEADLRVRGFLDLLHAKLAPFLLLRQAGSRQA